jgi:hypothetical protein
MGDMSDLESHGDPGPLSYLVQSEKKAATDPLKRTVESTNSGAPLSGADLARQLADRRYEEDSDEGEF